MPDVGKQCEDFRKQALEQWVDGRLVSREWLDTHIWFWQHLYSQFTGQEFVFRGCAFKVNPEDCLLVVKISRRGLPQVAFITSQDTTHCISKFKRLLAEDRVQWYDDKFA